MYFYRVMAELNASGLATGLLGGLAGAVSAQAA